MSPEDDRLAISTAHAATTEAHDALSRAMGHPLTSEERAHLEAAHSLVDQVWRSIQRRRAEARAK
jgi:hypothetical protein